VRVGDVVIGRGIHDLRLGICTEVNVNHEKQVRVVYEWGSVTYDALHSRRDRGGSMSHPRIEVLGKRQCTFVNAAIAAEALRRMG
jgi:hypothetical protein